MRVQCEYCGRVLLEWRPECPSCGALLPPPPPSTESIQSESPPPTSSFREPPKAIMTKDEVWNALFQRVQECIHNLQRCFPWDVWAKRHDALRRAFSIPRFIEPWAIYFSSDGFEWASEGLVFADEGLFWKNFLEDPVKGFMTWKEMALLWRPEVIEPCPNDNKLICFGKSPLLEIGKPIDALYLSQVLQSIVALLHRWDEVHALLPKSGES